MTLLHQRAGAVLADPREAEALIREARRLRRRRWIIGFLVVGGAGIGWALAGGSPSRPDPPPVPRHHVSARADFRPGLPVGPYANLKVAGPLAVASTGALYVADTDREQVLVRLPDGRFRTVAGNGTKGTTGDGGSAVRAEFLEIEDMAVAPDGSLYIVDGDRVRVVSPNGVISTVAGLPGTSTPPPCCGPLTLPSPIPSGTPARVVSIDQENSAAVTLSPQGVLYISTGLQLLRLDADTLDVVPTSAAGPVFNGRPLTTFGSLGQIAFDAQGDLYVSGGNGWAIWRVAPNGTATEVDPEGQPEARRSGGNTSVLERAPSGDVYGESGARLLELEGDRAVPVSLFPQGLHSYFWLTYFAFGPDDTVYGDEIPGSGGFERYQQLRVVHGTRSSLLWQQTSADVPPVVCGPVQVGCAHGGH